MNKKKILLSVILFVLGLTGVLSLLAGDIFASLPEESLNLALQTFSRNQLIALSLLSPTIMVLIAVLLGYFTFEKAGFDIPLIKGLIEKENALPIFFTQLKYGIVGGVIAGLAIVAAATLFEPLLPQSFIDASKGAELAVITRFLYGGITEEVLLRFGIMSLIAFLLTKISTHPVSYWLAIILAAVIFGIGHLPAVYGMVETVNATLITYIIFGNTLGGVVFGWLYWKKGLEAAMIAHIVTHVVMLGLL